jgi:hypothetical protein
MKVVSSSIIENEEVSSVKAGYVSSGKYKDEDTLIDILSMACVQRGELDAVENPHRIQEFIALVLTLLVGALSGAIAMLVIGHYILGLF